MSRKEIVVHSLADADAALAAASACDLPVTLASAPGAALQAGPAWFKAVIAAARAHHLDRDVTAILDCGDSPGAVMASLREGLTNLRFSGTAEVRDKLAAMGAIFAPPAELVLDLLGRHAPVEACTQFLAAD